MKSLIRLTILALCPWVLNPFLPVAQVTAADPSLGRSPIHESTIRTGYAGHYGCRGFSGADRALCVAASDGDSAEARRLVKAGADLSATSDEPLTRGMTILHVAVWHKWDIRAVTLLIDLGADANAKDGWGNTALIYAAEARPDIRLPLIRLLLESGADVKARGKKGMTALMHASMHDDAAALRMLLDAGADVREKDTGGWTALMHATRCNRGHPSVVALLIEAGSDVNAAHRYGGTAIASAAYQGHTEAVELLIKAHADVNAKDVAGWTPLICASTTGHAGIVERLIEAGADVLARDKLGRTSLSAARAHGDATVVDLLVAAGAK